MKIIREQIFSNFSVVSKILKWDTLYILQLTTLLSDVQCLCSCCSTIYYIGTFFAQKCNSQTINISKVLEILNFQCFTEEMPQFLGWTFFKLWYQRIFCFLL
uniref:Uncharacterized protein n=1 Tax=Cacopsylla melanoneura TaxID=428564 RepID=A0A8D8MD91_9HEMI